MIDGWTTGDGTREDQPNLIQLYCSSQGQQRGDSNNSRDNGRDSRAMAVEEGVTSITRQP